MKSNEKNIKKFLMISLFIIPIIAFESLNSESIPIIMALGMEAFVSIHMSIMVLKPLSVIFSPQDSKKTFWKLFTFRAVFLLIFDFFVTTFIFIVDFIAVFVGIFLVVPICQWIFKSNETDSINQDPQTIDDSNQNNASIFDGEIRCTKCNSILKLTDKFCQNCGETVNANELYFSKNVNSQTPVKVLVHPTNFDSIYCLSEEEMLNQFIDKELTKAGINKYSRLIPTDTLKRKKILNLIFSFLVFVFITLIFFHFPIYTYIIGIIILYIFFKVTRKYDLIKYLKKQIIARPSEKISNIFMNAKNNLVSDNSRKTLLISMLVAIVLPLIIFFSPKILYEKVDGGYAVRYYIFGLTNFKIATIPETHNNEKVVSLRGNTFSNMPFLKIVFLPDSITEIRGQAFKNCINLETVTIPKKLEYLGGGAFYNASSIKNIELPDSLTFLGGEAFYKSKSLETIKLSNNLTEIRGDTFEYCTSLRSITIPDSVERIGGHAFYGDSSLSEVLFTKDSNLVEIGSSAFRQCPKLYSITVPNDTYINERAFKESPTNIDYFSINYNNDNNNYYKSNDSTEKISVPYVSDFMLFKNKRKILNLDEYSLALEYSTGILNNGYHNEAYISGFVNNPLFISGEMTIKVHFYDNEYNELLAQQEKIELLGPGYTNISLYCGASIEKLPVNKTADDIYYYKIEILQLSKD